MPIVQLIVIGLCNWILINVTKCNTNYRIVKLWIAPLISNFASSYYCTDGTTCNWNWFKFAKESAQFLLDIIWISHWWTRFNILVDKEHTWLPNGANKSCLYSYCVYIYVFTLWQLKGRAHLEQHRIYQHFFCFNVWLN